jgi:HEAT repeat protein/DNA replication protein DnaC
MVKKSGQPFRKSSKCDKNGALDFHSYLKSISKDEKNKESQEVYTSILVRDDQHTQATSLAQHSLRLKLRIKRVNFEAKQDSYSQEISLPQEKVEHWDVLAGLRHYAKHHVLLVGKPGSGKSTALQQLLWEEAHKARQDSSNRIPVLVRLRRCTESIEKLIQDVLSSHGIDLEIDQIKKIIKDDFLILLDGLNELPEHLKIEVANFRDRYPKTPMIVSTRNLILGGTLGIEKTLEMLPLTTSQIQEFIQGYLGKEGDRLFQQLQGDRLEKFAETPLLLWMLCQVFDQNSTIPDNLGLVFREFARFHDQKRQEDAPADSKDQWHNLLCHLAFVMMQGKTLIDPQLSIPKEEAEDCLTKYLQQMGWSNPRDYANRWLKDLLKYHLIQSVIQPNFEEHIEFRHQLIQEYYAAEYLLKLLPALTDEQLTQNYLNYLKWTESIALMLALEDDEVQSLRVVKLAINQVDLMLGAKLAEDVTPQSSVSELIDFFNEFNESDWEIRTLLIRKLGVLQSAAAIPLLLEELDNELIYSTAIDALSNLGIEMLIPRLLKFWKEDSYVISRGEGIYLSLRDDAYTCLDLEPVEFLNSDEMVFILHKIYEDPDWDICTSTLSELARFGIRSTIPNLLKIFQDLKEYKSVNMAELFGNVGNEELILKVLKIVEELDYVIDKSAVEVLNKLGSEIAYPILIKGLFYSHWLVCRIVADTLGYIGCKSAVPRLIKVLGHSNWFVRRSAENAIIKISGESTMDVYLAIFAIQENCKFYNYEIHQAHLVAQQADRQASQKSDRPSTIYQFTYYDLRGAKIANLAHEVHGDQIAQAEERP